MIRMSTSAPNVIDLVRNADEAEIRSRLAELDAESDALKTLLRSVMARDRARKMMQSKAKPRSKGQAK